MAFDYKKEYKEFYMPKGTPSIVTVPKMNYIAVRGSGNPNEEDGEYKKAMENGATSVLEPELEPWGQRTCYIADPEGNLIEIGSWNKSYETKDLTEG